LPSPESAEELCEEELTLEEDSESETLDCETEVLSSVCVESFKLLLEYSSIVVPHPKRVKETAVKKDKTFNFFIRTSEVDCLDYNFFKRLH
jgi:hypothetical protein